MYEHVNSTGSRWQKQFWKLSWSVQWPRSRTTSVHIWSYFTENSFVRRRGSVVVLASFTANIGALFICRRPTSSQRMLSLRSERSSSADFSIASGVAHSPESLSTAETRSELSQRSDRFPKAPRVRKQNVQDWIRKIHSVPIEKQSMAHTVTRLQAEVGRDKAKAASKRSSSETQAGLQPLFKMRKKGSRYTVWHPLSIGWSNRKTFRLYAKHLWTRDRWEWPQRLHALTLLGAYRWCGLGL